MQKAGEIIKKGAMRHAKACLRGLSGGDRPCWIRDVCCDLPLTSSPCHVLSLLVTHVINRGIFRTFCVMPHVRAITSYHPVYYLNFCLIYSRLSVLSTFSLVYTRLL